MKITITGSLGNISKPLAKKLKAAGHQLTIISHSEKRRAEIEELGATAAIGSINDATFLKNTFTGADAAYVMVPPAMGGNNIVINTGLAGEAIAKAIVESGVKRVVLLSSVGADLETGTGPIAGLYKVEQHLNKIAGVNFTFLRAGYFYINFYNNVPMIQNMKIMGGNFAATTVLPLAHPEDIASAVAEELQMKTSSSKVRYIVSDLKTLRELAGGIGAGIEIPELPWVEFSDEDALKGMKQAGLPEELAELYTEMGRGFRTGKLTQHFIGSGSPVSGKIKLGEFAKEFASEFNKTTVA
ncbi:MAG: NmrA family NAD(P)-binding protein [Bacteroidota bacterium]